MILILFLFIFLIVLTLIFKNRETFRNLINPKVKFMSISEGCNILKNVKELNNYNDLDFKIRKIDKKIYGNNVSKYYCEHLLDFTKTEKILLKWLYDNLYERTPKNLRFLYENIKFAKYENIIENGFPHTHSDVVFLTESFIHHIIQYYNTNSVEEMIENIGVIIVHECVHIWQRKNKKIFYKLYVYYWNFIKVDKIHNNIMQHRIRFNPDGVDTNWVYKFDNKYIIPLSIYTENAKNIGSVRCVGIYLNKNGISFSMPHKDDLKMDNLTDIDGFNKLFKNVHGNHYHPHELSAELISIYYMKKMNISHKNFNNKALDKIDIWYRKDVFPKYVYFN